MEQVLLALCTAYYLRLALLSERFLLVATAYQLVEFRVYLDFARSRKRFSWGLLKGIGRLGRDCRLSEVFLMLTLIGALRCRVLSANTLNADSWPLVPLLFSRRLRGRLWYTRAVIPVFAWICRVLDWDPTRLRLRLELGMIGCICRVSKFELKIDPGYVFFKLGHR